MALSEVKLRNDDRYPAAPDGVDAGAATDGYVWTYDAASGGWIAAPAGVTDHGALTGLSGDDHPHYLNNARGDSRYAALTHKARHATGAADAIAPGDIGAATSGHGHASATTTTAGFESAADKAKLDAAGFPRITFVAPSFSNTDHVYTSTGWQSTPLGVTIPCAALGVPPAGYVWKVDVIGGIRMFPPSSITVGTPVFLSLSLTGAVSSTVDGGGFLPFPQAALPLSAYKLDPPTLTEAFTVRFYLWIGQVTGTYRIAPGPYPACIAHLERA